MHWNYILKCDKISSSSLNENQVSQLKGWEPEWPNPQTSDFSPPNLKMLLKCVSGAAEEFQNVGHTFTLNTYFFLITFLGNSSNFRYLLLRLGHSGSRPFNYVQMEVEHSTVQCCVKKEWKLVGIGVNDRLLAIRVQQHSLESIS